MITEGGQFSKVCSSAKFGVVVFMASILNSPGGSISQSRFVCQFLCTGMQGISALLPGGLSATVCSSAKFGVVVFKASLLCYPGRSISQSRFICQVWCSDIQGISALLPRGVHLPRSALTTILHITPGKI